MTAPKQPMTVTSLPEQQPGEGDKAYARRLSAWLAGDDVRTKTDLRDWTGSPPFHLDVPEKVKR